MKNGCITAFKVLVSLISILGSTLFSGCNTTVKADPNVIDLGGAWDMYYLSVAINSHNVTEQSMPPIKMNPSTTTIADLKTGKRDAVILGREPTSEELQGLKDYVIGYDAVVILIDENSYIGGMTSLSGSKTAGLHNLTTDELKTLFGTGKLPWSGDYYTRYPLIDPGGWIYNDIRLGWDKQTKFITSFYKLSPGKYDTQAVLYQKLGVIEPKTGPDLNYFTDPQLNFEEEVLSTEYPPDSPYMVGSGDFIFKITFASRRVAAVALKHIPIRVVSVDGINPLDQPETIYDGTYPFSRKLHLLVRNNPDEKVTALVEFLQSQPGQKIITDAGYLPLTPDYGDN